MKWSDLSGKRVVIWGLGKEGLAAAHMLRDRCAEATFVFVDEAAAAILPENLGDITLITDSTDIEDAVMDCEVVIKSPGVSLSHPVLQKFLSLGGYVTSLLNLWVAENEGVCVVAVTGSKGKSTTSSLLEHVLKALGQRVALLGNIGVPVTTCAGQDYDVCVVEVSSYQAANFDGACRIGVLTSLFPEHLDWHKTLDAYYRDKCNLLMHCDVRFIEAEAYREAKAHGLALTGETLFNTPDTFHVENGHVCHGGNVIGLLENDFLAREHNHGNVCAALSVVENLGLNVVHALTAMKTYQGLPHRQQVIGEVNDVLFVDDSISTTPHSAVAAMKAYAVRPLTLIAGGQDRGIDYDVLYAYVRAHDVCVVCLGESGARMNQALSAQGHLNVHRATSMDEAVHIAKDKTPRGGAILLSPASPSFDMYKNYIDRAEHFIRAIGLEKSERD